MGNNRVLIVDDAIDLGRLLQDALKTVHPGIPITVVPSAEEAILESTRFTIDLLISDIRLPGMTGLELVRKIRIRQPNVRIMLISGLSIDRRLKAQIDELKPDAFLHKPMGMPEFLSICDQLLDMQPPKPAEADDEILNAVSQAMPGVPKEELIIKPGGIENKVVAPVQEEPGTLSTRLSGLRSSLGAVAVMLVDDNARVVAQAGNAPDTFLTEPLFAAGIHALSAGARLSYLIDATSTHSVQAYHGKEYDLVFAPVGQYSVMIVLRASRSALRLALAFEEALIAQDEIAAALEKMGLHIQSVAEVGAPESMAAPAAAEANQMPAVPAQSSPDLKAEALLEVLEKEGPELGKFEELFASADSIVKQTQDADSFWDSIVKAEGSDPGTPGVLSYDQAQKLGLLPDGDDHPKR